MKGLLSRGLKNGNYFIVVFVIGHTINTKGIHREKKNHPTHLQPIAREEVGRGCWRGLCGGVTLVKRAQLQQWVCRGGRGGGRVWRPRHSRGVWCRAGCNDKHDKGDNESFLIKWLSHVLISAHKEDMRGLGGFQVVSLMWFFLSSSVFYSGHLWLYFCHGVSFFLWETPQTFQKHFICFLYSRKITLSWQDRANRHKWAHPSSPAWSKYSPYSSKDCYRRFR